MSSMLRSMERSLIRHQVEEENAPKRTKLRMKRKNPTDKLSIERNVILFKRAWFKHHYGVKEIVDEKGNTTTTIAKRKKIKRTNPHTSGNNLISRLRFTKNLKEKMQRSNEV